MFVRRIRSGGAESDPIRYHRGSLLGPVLLLTSVAALPPNYDAFYEARPASASSAPRTRGHSSSFEPRFDVPSFHWAERGQLADGGAELAARHHLARHASTYRLDPELVDALELVGLHDTGVGAIVATFGARVEGVAVFREELHVVMKRAQYELVAISGYLPPQALRRDVFVVRGELTESAALAMAALDLSGALFEPSDFDRTTQRGDFAWYDGPKVEGPFGALFPEALRVRPVVYAMPDGLFSAYHVELAVQRDEGPTSAVFAYVIDATKGNVLFRKNLTEDAAFSYRVYAEPNLPHRFLEGPQGDAWLPHPTARYEPFVTQTSTASLVTLEYGPIATRDPWLPHDATETNGNNVDAYADLAEPDGLNGTDFRAQVTSPRTFDYTHRAEAQPDLSQEAAIVQLFYINNYLHDWFYDRGFDERAGNAQRSNYGRGGQEDDNLRAEVQDYSGTDNANMSTRADGARPRMQMYVWTARSHASISIASPSSLAGDFVAGTARFGPADVSASGVLAVVDDGTGDPLDGCQPYVNTSSVAGRIALVARNNCNFLVKAQNAEAAGALGVVMTDNRFGWVPPDMNNSDPTSMAMVSVTEELGDRIRARIAADEPVSVTIRAVGRPDKDSSLDAVIVSHEWGHYLSNRLVANASGLSQLQARGMGEGWGDFVGLLMASSEDDALVPANVDWSGSFGVGVNSSYKHPYFGIRRMPYSVDFAKNALTFRMIAEDEPLPTSLPIYFGWTGAGNSAVHRTGEVWATMLWEAYVVLLRDPRHTFDDAKDRMSRYLVAGLEATPVDPTFVEARDAMLSVAYANDPVDFRSMYEAFARRGLGLGAVAPDRAGTDHRPVVESFDVGNAVEIFDVLLDDEALFCDRDGVLDAGETGRLRVAVKNVGIAALANATARVSTDDPRVSFPNGDVVNLPSFLPFEVAEVELRLSLTGSTDIHEVTFDIEIAAPSLTATSTLTGSATFRVNSDAVANASTTDDVESPASPWLPTLDNSLEASQPCERIAITASEHRWFCPNVGAPADLYLTSLPITVSSTGAFTIAFDHRYDIEDGWDGAILELSDDAGMSWVDVGALASPPYDGALRDDTPNPLEARDAWTGNNPSYPAFDRVFVDLQDAYQGQTVVVRFRIGSDTAVSGAGWEIDDITVTGVDGAPFPSLTVDDGVCINRRPVADAGADFTIDEGATGALDPSGSTDVDGDTLQFVWRQVEGPSTVVATDGTFEAPLVEEDTPLVFRLTALDADLSDTATVVVTVLDSNRPVSVDAGLDQTVEAGVSVTLAGAASDPDGDDFVFAWSQTAGPSVTLAADDTLAPSFDATTPGTLTFELRATEREHTSSDEVTVVVGAANRAPTITLGPDQDVAAGAQVVVEAAVEDPDGDTLTVRWRQVDGPSVTLTEDGLRVTFVASATDAEIVVEATVDDGARTAAATTTIRVRAEAPMEEASGCGCRAGGSERGGVSLMVLVGLFALRRRTRRSRAR